MKIKKRKFIQKNQSPLLLLNYSSKEMLIILESNNGKVINSSNVHQYNNNIYEILLKTGRYFDAKDIQFLNIIIFLFIMIIKNPKGRQKKKQKTPLHYAAEKNSVEIGKLLILKGADINEIDTDFYKIRTLLKLRKISIN